MATRAACKVAIRISGGCKGMSDQDKADMLEFFSKAFTGYQGLIWSGATRQVTDNGLVDPMVTDMPGVIAKQNPGCVALGTAPRTDMLTLQEESRLVLDEWGTVPNPDMSGILIVQNGADGKMDWDGDLDAYFQMMESWKKYAGFTELGLISWNGGDITKKEIEMAIKHNWTVILVQGSGRATDEYIKKHYKKPLNDLPESEIFEVCPKDDPRVLRYKLDFHGFLESTEVDITIFKEGDNIFINGLPGSSTVQWRPAMDKEDLAVERGKRAFLLVTDKVVRIVDKDNNVLTEQVFNKKEVKVSFDPLDYFDDLAAEDKE
jgi:hypothetical protein